MIRSLALTLLVGMALPLSAQAQPRLFNDESIESKTEFLRNLRRKGYASLAKEFGDQLLKTAKEEEIPILTLEQARTAVALAKEKGPGQRMKLLDEARASFEPFLKSNPNSAVGAQARLEMAALLSMQALMRLNKAHTPGAEEETRERFAKEARDLYDAADGEFGVAIKIFNDINQKKEGVLAEFDRALNMIEKAATYINTDNPAQNRKRAETVDAARQIFAEFAKDKETTNGLLANAHLIKCYQELQDPSKANDYYLIVTGAQGAAAAPAQRLARYYDILYDKARPTIKGDRLKSVIDRTNDWLQRYPAARKSYEGEHLRYEQALSYYTYASAATDGFKKEKYDKIKSNTKEKLTFDLNLNNADKLAKELQSENGDFSDRGAGLHALIERTRIVLENKGLASFESAMFIADDKFREAAAGKGDAQKLFREGQSALRAAIAQGEKEGAPPSKLHDAQYLMGRAFLSVNDLRRSAISFDALARANPPSKKGAEAAGQALRLYKYFVDEENDVTAREYLHDLGDFVLAPTMARLWSGDPVIGVACHNLAMDYFAQEKHKEALAYLEKMPKDSLGYAFAQSQAVFIALSARKATEVADEKKAWMQAAKTALSRIGSLPTGADAATAQLWFNASLQGPEFLYADAAEHLKGAKLKEASDCYREMAKGIAAVEAVFAKEGDKLPADKKKQVGFTIEVLKKYAHLGAADIEYRKGNYEKVLEDNMLGGLVKEIYEKGTKDPKGDIQVLEVQVVGESMTLVLRSLIQLGRLEQAKGAYVLMMRIKSASSQVQDNAKFSRDLIRDLGGQVEEMKKKNDPNLKVMLGKFTSFADALAKSLVYENKKFNSLDIENLARLYSSLDQFKKAADLFKVVPEPKFLNQTGLKATEEQEKELLSYWSLQLEYGNLLRKSKDYEAANKVYVGIMNHPNSRAQLAAKKEQIHIYEDRETYGPAIKLWKDFMDSLQRTGRLGQEKKLQEVYFDAYYHNALCFYKHSQLPKVIKDGKEQLYLNNAASLIYRLETSRDNLGWQLIGPRFLNYMQNEKKLKDAYEALKKKGP
jgi:hypothetical protein